MHIVSRSHILTYPFEVQPNNQPMDCDPQLASTCLFTTTFSMDDFDSK